MKGLLDPTLLAACGGDTVKLFDVSAGGGGGDHSSSCVLSYVPSPGFAVHSLKWNHTNLVVASAGEDKKISLWSKNGQSMGTIPVSSTDSGDGIEESILAICFSSKSSRYICSGGSGQVVRIWDLQRKRCIKWLRGHTSTITGAMYNCKDDSLASIGVNGNIILHNLAYGAKSAELKDPNEQVLRVLDFSRTSRHLLVVAGDDGTVRLWDKNSSSPKISWSKQHLAPAAGISFSPTNDKMIASVGLDKKLYTFDSGSKRPSSYITYESPFSSLAFKDDGLVLAAGTSNGRIVFYDVRAKPQPFTVLTAYGSSEAVTSLCWQRPKPVKVNESTCSAETALLGGAVEDSILMPDPLPSMASSGLSSSSLSSSAAISGSWNPSRFSSSLDAAAVASTSGSTYINTSEETPHRSHLWPGGTLARLNAPRTSYNLKDEMGVFSPLRTPITPALEKLWNDSDGSKKDHSILERNPSFLFPSASQRFPFANDRSNDHPILDLKSSSFFSQDDSQILGQLGSAPALSSKSEDTSVTPPKAWGGEKLSDRYANPTSRFGLTAGWMLSGHPDVSSSMSQTSISSLTGSNFTYTSSRNKDLPSLENRLGYSESFPSSSSSPSLGSRSNLEQAAADPLGPTSLAVPRLLSSYAERRSASSAFNDGTSVLAGSPKLKKTGAETREELLNSLLSRSYTSSAVEAGILPLANGGTPRAQAAVPVESQQASSSFSLQLFERTLVETLDSFQKSIHRDTRNLHIEVLRQAHLNQMDMSKAMGLLLENQAELKRELQLLREENQQLRKSL